MSFEAFVGLWIFSFLVAYAVLVIFNGVRDIFPHERPGIKIDFRADD